MDGNPPGVDINSASLEELTRLPGLKQRNAERIIAGRPYRSIDDLQRVKALPAALLEGLRPFLTISPATEASREPILGAGDEISAAETPVGMPVETQVETPIQIPVEAQAETPAEMPAEEPAPEMPSPEMTNEEPIETSADESLDVASETPSAVEAPVMPTVQDEMLSSTEPQIVAAPIEVAAAGPDVPVLPAVEPVSEAEPAQAPNETITGTRPLTNRRLIGCGAMMGAAAVFLSIAVTLLLLLAINGSLSFATYNQYAALSRQEQDLSSQVSGIQQDVTAMQARLAAVESLGGRVSSLETDSQSLRTDLQTSQQQLAAAQTQLNQLSGQITQIEQRSQAFSQFIEGLRSLISQIPTTQP
ncbi:MAG: helix-hairpin-helix domain-containing protein [Anaerolineaceae bacterium]|nr:helix-hairpin-helix domain-containing protein [Anaerolineaceae bacterium]